MDHIPDCSSDSLWRIGTSPGKGRGVFAAKDIPKGALVMEEMPLLTISRPAGHCVTPAEVDRAFSNLTSQQQSLFLSLSDAGIRAENRTNKVYRIFQTNALTDDPDTHSYICTKASLINHSCIPNATWHFSSTSGKCVISALASMKEGEELTLNYAGDIYWMKSKQRKACLRYSWGFECDCKACQSDTAFGVASDYRRALLCGIRCIMAKRGSMIEQRDLK